MSLRLPLGTLERWICMAPAGGLRDEMAAILDTARCRVAQWVDYTVARHGVDIAILAGDGDLEAVASAVKGWQEYADPDTTEEEGEALIRVVRALVRQRMSEYGAPEFASGVDAGRRE